MRKAGAWAAEKLDYLRRIIEVFETSMREKWQIRNYIDLLAGPGKNRIRGTNQVLLGSPLIALNVKYPFTNYYFIDSESNYTDALHERCKSFSEPNRIHIYTGDANLLVDQVVNDLKPNESHSLNLAFIDPEGFEISWNTVVRLAGIRRMDLVINYPQGGLNRLMAKDYLSISETPIDVFFGTTDWRKIYAKYKNQNKAGVHRELIDLYNSRLQELGYQEVKRGDETVGYEPLIRNVQKNAPLYRLVYASKNPLGQKFWQSVTKRNVYGQRRLLDSL